MKKGFTILELLIALAIASIVTALVSTLYLKYHLLYSQNTKFNRDYFYSTEALMFIQNEVRNSKSISINNNIIEVKYPDGVIKKYIKYSGNGSLIIIHTENDITLAVNNILNNVGDFRVFQKNSTIYVSILINGGEKYERCFGVNLD